MTDPSITAAIADLRRIEPELRRIAASIRTEARRRAQENREDDLYQAHALIPCVGPAIVYLERVAVEP